MTRHRNEKEPAPRPKGPSKEEQRIDEEIEDSFPASDPPSYAGHGTLGEPKRPKDPKQTP